MIVALLVYLWIPSEPSPFLETYEKAKTAMNAENWTQAETHWKALDAMAPNHPRIHLSLAKIYAAGGHAEKAFASLKKCVELGLAADFKDPVFAGLKDQPGYKSLKRANKNLSRSVVRAVTAFEIAERDLIPEGITYDPVDDVFYLGSIRKNKILRVDRKGNASVFADSQQDGLMGVAGMKVDANRRLLWACTGHYENWSMGYAPELKKTTALHLYDLKTGKLKKKFALKEKGHYLNDLTIAEDGTVYVSDSETSRIYTARPGDRELRVFLDSPNTFRVNGLVLAKDQKRLYVAALDGLKIVDLKTREVRPVTTREPFSFHGIDGLTLYGDRLAAVQNGLNRTVLLTLDQSGEHVELAQVLDANHPQFSVPTTGCMAGENYYTIANSQMDALNEKGEISDPDALEPTRILVNWLGEEALPPYKVDGYLTAREWGDAIPEGVTVREDDEWLYFGVRSNVRTTIHLYLRDKDTLKVMHASASLGTAVYQKGESGWDLKEPYVWEVRDPVIRARFEAPVGLEREAFEYARTRGWLASTMLMGGDHDAELKVSKKVLAQHEGYAVGWWRKNEASGKREIAHYPASAVVTGFEQEQLLFRGESPESVSFQPEGWKEP